LDLRGGLTTRENTSVFIYPGGMVYVPTYLVVIVFSARPEDLRFESPPGNKALEKEYSYFHCKIFVIVMNEDT
jgi:hypothetical protein